MSLVKELIKDGHPELDLGFENRMVAEILNPDVHWTSFQDDYDGRSSFIIISDLHVREILESPLHFIKITDQYVFFRFITYISHSLSIIHNSYLS
ncbi:MAG: hypothetical protein KAH15_05750 [Candidatus Marinimicrobia bacterium]|nr:hypothetical protein [Candidatus Neomarinimicrobiota bacterium]